MGESIMDIINKLNELIKEIEDIDPSIRNDLTYICQECTCSCFITMSSGESPRNCLFNHNFPNWVKVNRYPKRYPLGLKPIWEKA